MGGLKMRAKIFGLSLTFTLLLSTNVLAIEKLPPDVLKAFQAEVGSLQNMMLQERDATHHLSEAEIFKSNDSGYKVYRIDPNKLNNENIDLYESLYTNDTWYIPVSDRVVYDVYKDNGGYRVSGYGVYDEKDAIPYEIYEKTAKENGLKDFVFINEPALRIIGFVGKTEKGSRFLSFNNNNSLKLEKNKIKNGKELMNEIKTKVNDAKIAGSKGFGGSGGFTSTGYRGHILLILFSICIVMGLFMFNTLRLRKNRY